MFGVKQSELDVLKAEVKRLSDRLDTKAGNPFGVGERILKQDGYHSYYDYGHHITVEEAIRKLAAHLGVKFTMTTATPAMVKLEKVEPVWVGQNVAISGGTIQMAGVPQGTPTAAPKKRKKK